MDCKDHGIADLGIDCDQERGEQEQAAVIDLCGRRSSVGSIVFLWFSLDT